MEENVIFFEPATEQDLRALQKEIPFDIPDELISFLRKSDGAYIVDHSVNINGEDVPVEVIFGSRENEYSQSIADLYDIWVALDPDLDSCYLPIGDAPDTSDVLFYSACQGSEGQIFMMKMTDSIGGGELLDAFSDLVSFFDAMGLGGLL